MSDIDIQDPNEAIRELLMRISELEAENARLTEALRAWQRWEWRWPDYGGPPEYPTPTELKRARELTGAALGDE